MTIIIIIVIIIIIILLYINNNIIRLFIVHVCETKKGSQDKCNYEMRLNIISDL